MRIGITTDIRHSMFSAGHANTSFAIAQLFQSIGDHEIHFLHNNTTSQDNWWEDGKELQEKFPCIPLDVAWEGPPYDLIIESSFFLSLQQRQRIARQSVWYNRRPGLFTDLESTVYGCRPDGRTLDGISAIWTADIYTSTDDIQYLQTLYPTLPIYTVPWIWTPDIVESHRKTTGSPIWLQVYQSVPVESPWSLHITESNASSTSSCTIPLVTVRNLFTTKDFIRKPAISRVSIHNTDALKSNAFFKDNVHTHCEVSDISYSMVGRQRIIDWVHDPHSLILSHSRFIPIKMAQIEAAWVGIPIVHNSTLLQTIGFGLEKLYYPNNSIVGASAAVEHPLRSVSEVPYISNVEALTSVRNKILTLFHPIVHVAAWKEVLTKTLLPLPVQEVQPTFTVLFTDMWDNFNESHNMFVLALENALQSNTKDSIQVAGYSMETLPKASKPDIVLFGPFGEAWRSLPMDWPKVHYTGENSEPILHPSVKLNIGYKHALPDDTRYLRMPLWHLEIDWFGADIQQIQNPLPIPIDACTTSSTRGYDQRSNFCAFIVTNPKNQKRNQAFTTLNSYKPVASAGRLYNNVGTDIFAGLGGGGGELKKHEFLKNYRFCIAYENASTPGYTTEKLLHAKAAGCVPIYWGDSTVTRDFDSRGFLAIPDEMTPESLIRLVDTIENDPIKWSEMASIPALTTHTRDLVRRNFSDMVCRFFEIAGRKELSLCVPSLLGATTDAEATVLRKRRSSAKPDNLKILFVTGATQRFWPSVEKWLASIVSIVPSANARVYVGADVSDSTLELASSTYTFATFVRFPTETPSSFPDFWNPHHYAWKLWIYSTVVHDSTLAGSLIFYMDSGSVLVGYPTEWIEQARSSGMSCLDDCRQLNRSWCHAAFCDALSVTEAEKDTRQIAACLLLFVAGHPVPTRLFTEAYALGQQRAIVVGEKWSGIGTDGKPFGHRHDQSILSILSYRQGVCRYPIDKVYGDSSIHHTVQRGQAVYVHRGNFQTRIQPVDGIDTAFYINLDRREDRKKSFLDSHPDLAESVERLSAYDGKTLTLTPSMAKLFKANDFFWKKSVMGCAMSHLKLWTQLVNAPDTIQTMLILEDDVRLTSGWRDAWRKAYPTLPPEWDCIYLGGILPPNRKALSLLLEPVSEGLARVAANTVFGQKQPNRYCHFCAYAYVLSKRGAAKILQMIQQRGYWTSADHIICNSIDTMNIYVLDPLVAGASQDNDPIYQKAEFNNFNRVDTFDSDLWNNDERFTEEQIVHAIAVEKRPCRFLSLKTCLEDASKLYESTWLQELFQTLPFRVEAVSESDTIPSSDDIIVVVLRPNWSEQLRWLSMLRKTHTFKVLHLSDEYGKDPIEFYSWPEVKGILRFYGRKDLVEPQKVLVLPLGYHWHVKSATIPDLDSRSTMWCFAGADWHGRAEEMKVLQAIQPNSSKFFATWKDPENLKEEDYMALLLNSKCVPCPRGQNVETYRFYEALESGCIPMVIELAENDTWFPVFLGQLPLLKIPSWTYAAGLLRFFQENPEELEKYRTVLLTAWGIYKNRLKQSVEAWIQR